MNLQKLIEDNPHIHTDATGKVIRRGLSYDVLQFIERHVGETSITLETGAGVSTILFAMKGAEHTCIVPDNEEVKRIQEYCMQNQISMEKLHFYIDRSENILPNLQINELDLILIDGSHAFPIPFIDWYYSSIGLKVGGLLIIDDTQLWTGHVLKKFLLSEPEWDHKISLAGRTAIFVKLKEGSHMKEWPHQPYLVRNSSLLFRLALNAGHANEHLKGGEFLLLIKKILKKITG
jgi:predicted O-methyltransferase YrrM